MRIPGLKMGLLALLGGTLGLAPSCVAVKPSGPAVTQLAEDDFRTPPPSARPRVWWHWMNGNVTIEGIEKDIAWLERIGVGGLQYFDAALDTPQVVGERVVFGSQEWKDAIRTAVERSRQAGLEFTVASSPGFSETGGPWVAPEAAMKKLVWSQLDIEGGRPFSGRLPDPPSATGPFLDIEKRAGDITQDHAADPLPRRYRDVAVLAYRIPDGEGVPVPQITSSSPIDAARLSDGDRNEAVWLPVQEQSEVWVEFSYDAPQTIRAIELVLQAAPPRGPVEPSWPVGRIESSDDRVTYRTVTTLPDRGAPQLTLAIPETTARHFRLVLEPRFAPFPVAMFDQPVPVSAHGLMEVRLLSGARIDRYEDKAGWSNIAVRSSPAVRSVPGDTVINKDDVIDLSERLEADGSIDWAAPPGRWRIQRFGWSLTGKLVHPASAEATGLEVDKLSGAHVGQYIEDYLQFFSDAAGAAAFGPGGISHVLNDSYEAGPANWTDDLLDAFESRRGYDPRPWLPVMAGGVVTSVEASEQFLWDYRRTLSDLIASEHYEEITRRLAGRSMGRYGESHEAPRAFIGDGMEVKKSASVPMGAYWASPSEEAWIPDLLESASVAHLYGQNIVAAESFTSLTAPYIFAPEHLKPFADKMMVNGVNRFVIHTSAHQPLDGPGPGLGLAIFGQYFSRNETWAEMAKPWISYLSRSSHLLQQGRLVADIAWFYGEDENITSRYLNSKPAVPAGFRYDFVNADALRNLVRAEQGRILSPSGASYSLLVIDPEIHRMTNATLQAILSLADQGVPVVGKRPAASPSLMDDPAQFRRLADRLWGGSYRVFETLDAAIAEIGLEPDVDFGRAEGVHFVHRQMPHADIYFLANLTGHPVAVNPSFRVSGRAAEIWRAEDGSVCPAGFRIQGNRTRVPLTLAGGDAAFVVFRGNAASASRQVGAPALTSESELQSAWKVSFPPGHGAPDSAEMSDLVSLSVHPDAGVRYFSGTATYMTQFELSDADLATGQLFLDLGEVKNVAEIRLNGRPAGIAWRAPFRVEIGRLARAGTNQLEVRVANLWPNRLIGDRQAGAGAPVAFTTYNPYEASSPLLASGLLGPVKLQRFTDEPCAAR